MRVDMRNKVLCNDGTYDKTNGAVAPCDSSGGVKGNSNLPTKGKEDISKKLLGAYNQNLIIAVVLVGGYFAYKKYKK